MYVNADGSVLPCCIADHHGHLGNVQKSKISDIWNDDQYKSIRLNMLQGKECSQCQACYKSEQASGESFRTSVNKQFKEFLPFADDTNLDGSLNEMNLRYFDVRWSNICNFKCRSCSSTYSSSWAKEDNKKDVFIFAGGKNNDELYTQFQPHLQNMKEIYFAGGEPLLTDKHYDILEHLIAIGNTKVKLRYNTNLSNLSYKQKSVVDYWKKFSTVIVYVSLDSWAERSEYIREGTDWNLIEKNIDYLRQEVPNVFLELSSVISVFNVSTIPEFLNYIVDRKLFDADRMKPSFYNLINPDYYSFNILSPEYKQKIVEKLEKTSYNTHINNQIKSVIQSLNNSTYDLNLKQRFLDITRHYDTIRNRNFSNTFPELRNEMLF